MSQRRFHVLMWEQKHNTTTGTPFNSNVVSKPRYNYCIDTYACLTWQASFLGRSLNSPYFYYHNWNLVNCCFFVDCRDWFGKVVYPTEFHYQSYFQIWTHFPVILHLDEHPRLIASLFPGAATAALVRPREIIHHEFKISSKISHILIPNKTVRNPHGITKYPVGLKNSQMNWSMKAPFQVTKLHDKRKLGGPCLVTYIGTYVGQNHDI